MQQSTLVTSFFFPPIPHQSVFKVCFHFSFPHKMQIVYFCFFPTCTGILFILWWIAIQLRAKVQYLLLLQNPLRRTLAGASQSSTVRGMPASINVSLIFLFVPRAVFLTSFVADDYFDNHGVSICLVFYAYWMIGIQGNAIDNCFQHKFLMILTIIICLSSRFILFSDLHLKRSYLSSYQKGKIVNFLETT